MKTTTTNMPCSCLCADGHDSPCSCRCSGGCDAIRAHRSALIVISDIAEELADAHAAAPEVQDAGGPEAKDADGFDNTVLRERLAEAGVDASEDNIEALRKALRGALAALEAGAE
jgi:hypothetical protein